MQSKRENLEQSIESWQLSANHDRDQAVRSIAVAACGSAAASAGSIGLIEGQPLLGVPGIIIGTAMLIGGIKSAKEEIRSAMQAQGLVATRDYQLSQLEEASETQPALES